MIRQHLLGGSLVLAACLLIFPWIFHGYFFQLDQSDHMSHVGIAKNQMRLGRPTAPHHLYHSALIGIAKAAGSSTVLPVHAWWLNVAVATLSCLTTYGFLAYAARVPASYRAAALLAVLAVASAFLWELNALSTLYETRARWALGYIRFNSFHSPTLNLLRPLALLLFTAVLAVFRPLSRVQWAVAGVSIAALVVLSTMAKPNYIIALVPATVLFAGVRQVRTGRGHVRWGLVVVLVAATAWILEQQRNFEFTDEPRLEIGVQPFGVYETWGLVNALLPVRYLLSALFPLVVYVTYFRSASRSVPFCLALLSFAVALLQANLFVEFGKRAGAGNFTWGLHITLFVLFVVALAFFLRQNQVGSVPLRQRLRQWRFVVPGAVLLLHLANGLFNLTTPLRWG